MTHKEATEIGHYSIQLEGLSINKGLSYQPGI